MSDYEEDWDELVEEDVEHDPNRFDLGTCLTAPKVRFYTTKQLHGEYPVSLIVASLLIL